MSKEVKINPPAGGKKSLLLLEVGLIETVLVILALFLVFGALNYFNILSIYKLYPQQLGWLPHRPVQTKTRTTVSTRVPFFLSCPLPKELCLKGNLILSQNKSYQGLGFNLPEKTPLLAPFSGTYEIFEQKNTSTNSPPFMLLKITSDNYSAYFTYPTSGKLTEVQKVELKNPKKIKQGEQMAIIPKGEVSMYGKIYNLVFYVNREEGTAPPVIIDISSNSLSQKLDLNSYK